MCVCGGKGVFCNCHLKWNVIATITGYPFSRSNRPENHTLKGGRYLFSQLGATDQYNYDQKVGQGVRC